MPELLNYWINKLGSVLARMHRSEEGSESVENSLITAGYITIAAGVVAAVGAAVAHYTGAF
jgi:hypothetical protein